MASLGLRIPTRFGNSTPAEILFVLDLDSSERSLPILTWLFPRYSKPVVTAEENNLSFETIFIPFPLEFVN